MYEYYKMEYRSGEAVFRVYYRTKDPSRLIWESMDIDDPNREWRIDGAVIHGLEKYFLPLSTEELAVEMI